MIPSPIEITLDQRCIAQRSIAQADDGSANLYVHPEHVVMPVRASFWGFIILFALFLPETTFVSAQATANFAAWKEADNAENIADWTRRMLTRDFRDLTGTAREELLAQTLSALKGIAADSDVVPSTRYNAVLAVGQLESIPGTPPIAYPAALTYLVEEYQKAEAPHYLQYAALLGIVRHTILGIEPDRRDTVIDLLLDTVLTEYDSETWDWFRLTALDGLTALKTAGTEGNVAEGLLTLIDRKIGELEEWERTMETLTREYWQYVCRTIELASKAAKTLGDRDYPPATGIEADKMADTLIALIQAVCDVKRKIILSVEQGDTAVDEAVLQEQIVVNMKMCTQSVVWSMRSGFLAHRPSENSFYASLENGSHTKKNLDALMAEIVELTAFFDEGEPSQRFAATINDPKEFRFNLTELQDALAKCSAALGIILSGTDIIE